MLEAPPQMCIENTVKGVHWEIKAWGKTEYSISFQDTSPSVCTYIPLRPQTWMMIMCSNCIVLHASIRNNYIGYVCVSDTHLCSYKQYANRSTSTTLTVKTLKLTYIISFLGTIFIQIKAGVI